HYTLLIASLSVFFYSFFFNDTSPTEIYTLSLHDALPILPRLTLMSLIKMMLVMVSVAAISKTFGLLRFLLRLSSPNVFEMAATEDRKSGSAGMPRPISYAVFCLKKKRTHDNHAAIVQPLI